MAFERLLQNLSVGPLAPGAAIVVPHTLRNNGVALVPDSVLPTTATPIAVTAASTTSVTFQNNGVNVESATFRAESTHTIQRAPDNITGFYWQGTPAIGPVFTGASLVVCDVSSGSLENLPLAGLAPVNGAAIFAGDVVLARGQGIGSNNGPWVAAAGAWTRAPGADTSAECRGLICAVLSNTGSIENSGSLWFNQNPSFVTLGVDNLVFIRIGGVLSGAAPLDIDDSLPSTGNSLIASREDHRHGHGTRSGGNLHDVATTGDAGFMSAADKRTITQIFRDAAQTIGAVTVATTHITVPNNQTVTCCATVSGIVNGGGNAAGYQKIVTVKADGAGVLSLVGVATVVHEVEDDAAWDMAFDIALVNDLRIFVTGVALTTIDWDAYGYYTLS